ncbi:MAG: hypothetical protein ABSC11_02155 [Smithella sp.]|jgi:hypothetical protein
MLTKFKTYIGQEAWDEKIIRSDRELRRWCLTFLAFVMTYFMLEVIVRIFKL